MASVNRATRHMEGNHVAAPLPGLIGAVQREGQPEGKLVGGEWLLPLVGAAIDRVMSRKEAAILCGVSESELSKQVSGADGKSLNVRKLGALGERFLIAFVDEIRAFYKLDDPAAQQARGVELVTRGLAMLVEGSKR